MRRLLSIADALLLAFTRTQQAQASVDWDALQRETVDVLRCAQSEAPRP